MQFFFFSVGKILYFKFKLLNLIVNSGVLLNISVHRCIKVDFLVEKVLDRFVRRYVD